MDSPSPETVFHALAHPARRGVVEQLARGPATVSELAQPHDMSLPSFTQHLRVLEDAGLVWSTKQGRVRTYQLVPGGLAPAESWLAEQRALWTRRLDQLDAHLRLLQEPPT